jgi:hypothetical protein
MEGLFVRAYQRIEKTSKEKEFIMVDGLSENGLEAFLQTVSFWYSNPNYLLFLISKPTSINCNKPLTDPRELLVMQSIQLVSSLLQGIHNPFERFGEKRTTLF